MRRNLLCIALVGMSLSACGSDAKDSSAVGAASTVQTSAAGPATSPATPATDDVVTIPVSGDSDVAQRVCDGIGRALGEMAATPGAVAEMYGSELLTQVSSLLTEDEMNSGVDEEAVKATCPTEYAEFLTKAQTTTLFGVSAP